MIWILASPTTYILWLSCWHFYLEAWVLRQEFLWLRLLLIVVFVEVRRSVPAHHILKLSTSFYVRRNTATWWLNKNIIQGSGSNQTVIENFGFRSVNNISWDIKHRQYQSFFMYDLQIPLLIIYDCLIQTYGSTGVD